MTCLWDQVVRKKGMCYAVGVELKLSPLALGHAGVALNIAGYSNWGIRIGESSLESSHLRSLGSVLPGPLKTKMNSP